MHERKDFCHQMHSEFCCKQVLGAPVGLQVEWHKMNGARNAQIKCKEWFEHAECMPQDAKVLGLCNA
jgi:hypothetical protein